MAVDLSRGNFRKRVQIQIVSKDKDQSGGHDEDYTTLINTWAVVVQRGGVNVFDSGSWKETDEKDFYITWRQSMAVVNEDSKIVYEGRTYKMQKPAEWVGGEKVIVKYTMVGI